VEFDGAASDYEIVQRAIAYVTEHFRDQPEVEAIAHAAGVDALTLTELFSRCCGLSPKSFLQSVTLDYARRVLRESPNILEASYEVGLSGPGRLHDLFVVHEAMSPGEWKTGGEGLTVYYGFHPSLFGSALVNLVVSRRLRATAVREQSPALTAEAAQLNADVITAAGVGVGLVVIRLTGLTIIDPIISLLVAGLIAKSAFDVSARAFVDLTD
jgi:AraC-like DNA-binding protein